MVFIILEFLSSCITVKEDYYENYKDGEVRLKFDLIKKSYALNSDRWVFKRLDHYYATHTMETAIGYVKGKRERSSFDCFLDGDLEVIDVSLSFIDYLRYLNFKYDLRCESLRKQAEREREIENEKTIEIIKGIQSDINRTYDQVGRLGEKIKKKEQA